MPQPETPKRPAAAPDRSYANVQYEPGAWRSALPTRLKAEVNHLYNQAQRGMGLPMGGSAVAGALMKLLDQADALYNQMKMNLDTTVGICDLLREENEALQSKVDELMERDLPADSAAQK